MEPCLEHKGGDGVKVLLISQESTWTVFSEEEGKQVYGTLGDMIDAKLIKVEKVEEDRSYVFWERQRELFRDFLEASILAFEDNYGEIVVGISCFGECDGRTLGSHRIREDSRTGTGILDSFSRNQDIGEIEIQENQEGEVEITFRLNGKPFKGFFYLMTESQKKAWRTSPLSIYEYAATNCMRLRADLSDVLDETKGCLVRNMLSRMVGQYW